MLVEIMMSDKILSIEDYWNKPILGLTTFQNMFCIYENIFCSEEDEYSDLYYLTPIDDTTFNILIKNWNEWLNWMSIGDPKSRAIEWSERKNRPSITEFAKKSDNYRQYKKIAQFSGSVKNFHSKFDDYYVIWLE